MNYRRYYSTRTGKNPHAVNYDLTTLIKLFKDFYLGFLEVGYFQEHFGYYCVDEGDVAGKLGSNIDAQIFSRLKKDNLWPINEKCERYSEEDIFDIIEFLYDHVSKPLEKEVHHHTFNNCGDHYKFFDKESGQQEFREQINIFLFDYKERYELSDQGEILGTPEEGLEDLFITSLPPYDPINVEPRIQSAINKFRRYRSDLDEKRGAIRDLAEVLEFLRSQVKKTLNKDEGDLFNIANNFGIRHHNENQKQDYDKEIWYNCLFYYYLVMIRTCLRLIEKVDN